MPEIHMLADKPCNELVPILPCIPYRGIPRHTSQRPLHGVAGNVRHRRPYSRGCKPSSRTRPLTFVRVQRRRGEKDGPRLCVTVIEGSEPEIGGDLRSGAGSRDGKMSIDHYPK